MPGPTASRSAAGCGSPATPGHHADGPRRDRGQGPRPQSRCRRLRGQAVCLRRADGADPGDAASPARTARKRSSTTTWWSIRGPGRHHERATGVDLTAREYDLLLFFLRHPRQVLTREQVLENVWGYASAGRDQRRRGSRRSPAPEARGRRRTAADPDVPRHRLRAAMTIRVRLALWFTLIIGRGPCRIQPGVYQLTSDSLLSELHRDVTTGQRSGRDAATRRLSRPSTGASGTAASTSSASSTSTARSSTRRATWSRDRATSATWQLPFQAAPAVSSSTSSGRQDPADARPAAGAVGLDPCRLRRSSAGRPPADLPGARPVAGRPLPGRRHRPAACRAGWLVAGPTGHSAARADGRGGRRYRGEPGPQPAARRIAGRTTRSARWRGRSTRCSRRSNRRTARWRQPTPASASSCSTSRTSCARR